MCSLLRPSLLPLLLTFVPLSSSIKGPLGYGIGYGRYGQFGHQARGYAAYGRGPRITNAAASQYPAWKPWGNRYQKPDLALKSKPVLQRKIVSKIIKPKQTTTTTTVKPTTTTTTTTPRTRSTTKSFDDVFEIEVFSNAVDLSNIRNERLTIEEDHLGPATQASVTSSTKGWSLALVGFRAVAAVPQKPVVTVPPKYVPPSFKPVPAVPTSHQLDNL